MAKLTVANALFEVCRRRWQDDGWKVHRHLQPHRHDKGLLATPDMHKRIVKIYPHPTNELPEKTGLHEWLHIIMSLDGEAHSEEIVYFLENWLWKRLGKKQKALLRSIFVEQPA